LRRALEGLPPAIAEEVLVYLEARVPGEGWAAYARSLDPILRDPSTWITRGGAELPEDQRENFFLKVLRGLLTTDEAAGYRRPPGSIDNLCSRLTWHLEEHFSDKPPHRSPRKITEVPLLAVTPSGEQSAETRRKEEEARKQEEAATAARVREWEKANPEQAAAIMESVKSRLEKEAEAYGRKGPLAATALERLAAGSYRAQVLQLLTTEPLPTP
jgi:hypothetical protein